MARGATGAESITRPLYLVYLAKQGTFYPFAPTGAEQRDTELELRLRSMLAARSIEDLMHWSGNLYDPPNKFRQW